MVSQCQYSQPKSGQRVILGFQYTFPDGIDEDKLQRAESQTLKKALDGYNISNLDDKMAIAFPDDKMVIAFPDANPAKVSVITKQLYINYYSQNHLKVRDYGEILLSAHTRGIEVCFD